MIVLDASTVVDIVTDRPPKAAALTHLAGEIVSPAHQLAEVLSALGRLVRAGALSSADATGAAVEASQLQQEHVVPTDRHLRRALELQDNIRVLDGLYVALAEERECPLVTTDERLARAATCEVIVPAA